MSVNSIVVKLNWFKVKRFGEWLGKWEYRRLFSKTKETCERISNAYN